MMDMKRVEEITYKFYEWEHNLTEEEQDLALKTIKQQQEEINDLKKYKRVCRELKESFKKMLDDPNGDKYEWLAGFGAANDFIEDNLSKNEEYPDE